jgi:hypothetical protein
MERHTACWAGCVDSIPLPAGEEAESVTLRDWLDEQGLNPLTCSLSTGQVFPGFEIIEQLCEH